MTGPRSADGDSTAEPDPGRRNKIIGRIEPDEIVFIQAASARSIQLDCAEIAAVKRIDFHKPRVASVGLTLVGIRPEPNVNSDYAAEYN